MGDWAEKNEQNSDVEAFTERGIMSLVMQASELQQLAMQLTVVVAALALAHGISTDV